ncbi:NUDIX hydrolase [Haloarcula amylovorans]|uniref:NUDIX hydrolase n=1 Tax=Haloarcula amylovorans TaxID=2562280 RepID=UPI0037420A7F
MHGANSQIQPAAVEIRAGAKALIESATGVLLVKERHQDGEPFWTLPGGGLQSGEAARAGLRRELWEELQCPVATGSACGQWWYAHQSAHQTVTLYQVFQTYVVATPVPNPAEGVLAAQWVAPKELPARTLPQVRQLIQAR